MSTCKEAQMASNVYQQFFLQPTDSWHRRYEALRMVFLEGQPLTKVAQRFEVSYGTICNWVSEFRAHWDHGERPPFFKCPLEAGQQVGRRTRNLTNRKSGSQTFESCRWRQAAEFTPAARECSCSCHYWPSSGSISWLRRLAIPNRIWCPLHPRCLAY